MYLFVWIGKKQRDYAFIPTSLFRDYSLIRGFFLLRIFMTTLCHGACLH